MRARVHTTETNDTKKLTQVLEPLIRKIVREELARAAAKKPTVFYLEPGSPLYRDMEQIARETRTGKTKLLSREDMRRGFASVESTLRR